MTGENADKSFSELGHCAVFTKDLTLLWSDSRALFSQLEREGPKLSAAARELGEKGFGGFFFTFGETQYQGSLINIPGSLYLCRLCPERKQVLIKDELRLVAENAAELCAIPGIIKEAAGNEPDSLLGYAAERLSINAAEIFIAVLNMKNALEAQTPPEFIPIKKYLFGTFHKLSRFSERIGSGIAPFIDIRAYGAKIRYRVLETAILEILRIVYRSQEKAAYCGFCIWSEGMKRLCIKTEFSCALSDPHTVLKKDIGFLGDALANLNARLDLSFSGNRARIYSSLPVTLTDSKERSGMKNEYRLDIRALRAGESEIYTAYKGGGDMFLYSDGKEAALLAGRDICDMIFGDLLNNN